MSLLLCRREKVKHPFYIEVLGIHIYSSQELCYVIYHHPLLVMNDFVDASLFFFVKNELGLGFLAGRMEKLVEAGGRPEEALYLFLSECDYYTEKEIQKFKHPAKIDAIAITSICEPSGKIEVAIGIKIPKVPHEVPVANARPVPTKNKQTGKIAVEILAPCIKL